MNYLWYNIIEASVQLKKTSDRNFIISHKREREREERRKRSEKKGWRREEIERETARACSAESIWGIPQKNSHNSDQFIEKVNQGARS